jgi:hypothetical protein
LVHAPDPAGSGPTSRRWELAPLGQPGAIASSDDARGHLGDPRFSSVAISSPIRNHPQERIAFHPDAPLDGMYKDLCLMAHGRWIRLRCDHRPRRALGVNGLRDILAAEVRFHQHLHATPIKASKPHRRALTQLPVAQ